MHRKLLAEYSICLRKPDCIAIANLVVTAKEYEGIYRYTTWEHSTITENRFKSSITPMSTKQIKQIPNRQQRNEPRKQLTWTVLTAGSAAKPDTTAPTPETNRFYFAQGAKRRAYCPETTFAENRKLHSLSAKLFFRAAGYQIHDFICGFKSSWTTQSGK